MGLLERNPFDRVSPTRPKKVQVVHLDDNGLPAFDEPLPDSTDRDYSKAAQAADPLNHEEREAVLKQMSGQVRNLFAFGFWTGLRTGELIALRWCDVDWERSRIIVRLAFSKKVFTPTKGKRARWVPLLPPALESLRRQFEHTGERATWVFSNPVTHDRWSSSERLRRRWARAVKAARVRYRYQYQMRHTYASELISSGESAVYVAETMGHRDHRLVAVVYARWVPQADEPAGAKTARSHAAEWERLQRLLADNKDMVTAEDLAEDALPDEDLAVEGEVDPLDAAEST